MPLDDDHQMLLGDIVGEGDDLETDAMPAKRAYRMAAKRRMRRLAQRQQLIELLPTPPEPGESIHVVGNSQFDFWTFCPAMLEWCGGTDHFWATTWTLARANANEFFDLWDQGKFATATFLTGLYFKRRETATYALMLKGIQKRGGRYRASPNHAKVICMKGRKNPTLWLTVEGSANFTANPRVEQYVFTNDRGLYEFHTEWMNKLADAGKRNVPDDFFI